MVDAGITNHHTLTGLYRMLLTTARNNVNGMYRHRDQTDVRSIIILLCRDEFGFHQRQTIGIQHMDRVIVDFHIRNAIILFTALP